MKLATAKILANEKVGEDFRRMRLASPYLAGAAKPGQFVEIRCTKGVDPLLRRPLGCHRILNDGIEVLYEVVGKGTKLLSQRRAGETLDLIGPLGNGFDLLATSHKPLATILIAGGIGVAPLLALAERLVHSPQSIVHRKKAKVSIIIGAKTKTHVLCEKEFTAIGYDVIIATEDGSRGKKGLATDLLKDFLRATSHEPRVTIYACGPTGMLKAVAGIAKAHRIPCQVSLEERMACGVGVCLGCPVKIKTSHKPQVTSHEYKMVCKDGPVFNSEDIAW